MIRTMFAQMTLIGVGNELSRNGASGYEPLSSVWEGSDGDLLEAMLRFYATIPPEPILDATYNAGRFWKGSTRRVVSMDIDPQYEPMMVRGVSPARRGGYANYERR